MSRYPTAREVEEVAASLSSDGQTMTQIARATGIRPDYVGTALRALMFQRRAYYHGRRPVLWTLPRRSS